MMHSKETFLFRIWFASWIIFTQSSKVGKEIWWKKCVFMDDAWIVEHRKSIEEYSIIKWKLNENGTKKVWFFGGGGGAMGSTLIVSSPCHLWVCEEVFLQILFAGDACMVALERLFKSVESYFHPSNYGNWTDKLSSTLMFLPMGLVARLQLERFRPRDWMPEIPKPACLTDAQIKRFVRAFKPLAFLNLFSRAVADEAVEAIKNLALLAPDEIFPDLLEKFYASVDTLTEPLRFQAIVSALSASLPYLFSYKDGKKNVVPLMIAMLPGIDSNDSRKTMATLGFFS